MSKQEFEIGEEVKAKGYKDELFVVSSYMYQSSYEKGKFYEESSYILQSKRNRNKLVDVKPSEVIRIGSTNPVVTKAEIDILLDKYIEYTTIQEGLEILAGNGKFDNEFKEKANEIIEFLKVSEIKK